MKKRYKFVTKDAKIKEFVKSSILKAMYLSFRLQTPNHWHVCVGEHNLIWQCQNPGCGSLESILCQECAKLTKNWQNGTENE